MIFEQSCHDMFGTIFRDEYVDPREYTNNYTNKVKLPPRCMIVAQGNMKLLWFDLDTLKVRYEL